MNREQGQAKTPITNRDDQYAHLDRKDLISIVEDQAKTIESLKTDLEDLKDFRREALNKMTFLEEKIKDLQQQLAETRQESANFRNLSIVLAEDLYAEKTTSKKEQKKMLLKILKTKEKYYLNKDLADIWKRKYVELSSQVENPSLNDANLQNRSEEENLRPVNPLLPEQELLDNNKQGENRAGHQHDVENDSQDSPDNLGNPHWEI